jgi:hypothetical protein
MTNDVNFNVASKIIIYTILTTKNIYDNKLIMLT